MLQRGFTVHVSLSTTDAHSGVNPVLLDDRGSTYTLANNERLILTDLVAIVGSSTANIYGSSTLTTFPYLSFNSTANQWHTDYEGMSFPRSTLPWVVAPAGLLQITGTGYVIEDGGYVNTPPYVPIQGGLINS
jgi:hypothetical protein